MSSTERIRQNLIENNSALAKHSMNQKELRKGVHGQEVLSRITEGTKVIQRAEAKRAARDEQLQKETMFHEESKLNRIACRVLQTLNGYDGSIPEVFIAEVNYLIKNCK